MKKIKNSIEFTYCNPLSLPEIPRGKDDWYKFEKTMFSHENKPVSVTSPDYRSISDPTVFFWQNKWYLYPSYGMAWVSEDFQHWKHVRTAPYCPKYSPCIIPWRGKFLLTAWYCPLYIADTPLGKFKLLGDFIGKNGEEFKPCDPALFADDDGRIYLYAYEFDEANDIHKIVGYRLNENNPRQVIEGPVDIVVMDPEKKPWERHGLHAQNARYGWVEGPHLLKYGGRYYMIYASPDTCDASYCMAAYYSDTDPLHGFVCQQHNPVTYHRGGIVTGAGHGSIERGPNDTLWAFYTIACPYLHRYERRIGMDLVAVDKNGELYAPHGVTDTPQYRPGYKKNCVKNNDYGYVSLTGGVRGEASSHATGRDAVYATDENNLSFWLPRKSDKKKTIEFDLTGTFETGAFRVFWREVGLNYAAGAIPAPVRYKAEGYLNGRWFLLKDMSGNTEEKNIDYQTFPPKICSKARLTIFGAGAGVEIGVIDFALFGRYAEENAEEN